VPVLGYPIRTSRLLVRPWRAEEIDAYHALLGDLEVTRYLYRGPLSREQARVALAGVRTEIDGEGLWMNLAVELAADAIIVGEVGMRWVSEEHRQAEIGYMLLPAYRGVGYATEAARAMVDVAFDQLGAHRVCGCLDARNKASASVLERLGMRREAHLVENEFIKGEWSDEVRYAVLAREWRAATAGRSSPRA
jgi:RimJ/RimL family protein N-acetyltransferase